MSILIFASILIACGILMIGHWIWQKVFPPRVPLPPPVPDDRDSITFFRNMNRSE